jgi:hypothetical protein
MESTEAKQLEALDAERKRKKYAALLRWRVKNVEKYNASCKNYQRGYREKNREKLRDYHRQYRAKRKMQEQAEQEEEENQD